jgi:hypothetical protein
MGTIYFDRDKKAYGFPVADCVATTDAETWAFYAEKTCGVHWDIINGGFTPLKTQEQMQIEDQKAAKRLARNAALELADRLFRKASDEYCLDESDESDEGRALGRRIMKYRCYLRDFTKLDNWWAMEIPTFNGFIENYRELVAEQRK